METENNVCLLCGGDEPGNIDREKDFVCGKCMILLGSSTQEELSRAYIKATTMGNEGQATAIKMFLMEVKQDDRTTKTERLHNGTGTDRVLRSGKKDTNSSTKKGSEDAICESGKNTETVLHSRFGKLAGRVQKKVLKSDLKRR